MVWVFVAVEVEAMNLLIHLKDSFLMIDFQVMVFQSHCLDFLLRHLNHVRVSSVDVHLGMVFVVYVYYYLVKFALKCWIYLHDLIDCHHQIRRHLSSHVYYLKQQKKIGYDFI